MQTLITHFPLLAVSLVEHSDMHSRSKGNTHSQEIVMSKHSSECVRLCSAEHWLGFKHVTYVAFSSTSHVIWVVDVSCAVN